MTPDPSLFLGDCDVIDCRNSEIIRLAANLAGQDEKETAERCFRFVRDNVKHSSDYQLNPVTCTASAVLAYGTGYCYAKSHLLCALLRANKIPAGLCYQRLSINGIGAPHCLHGLNAVYLPDIGWYRIDARGNRDGINAQFTPPEECLAFPTEQSGEYDLPGIYVAPLPNVVDALRKYDSWDILYGNLPDIPDG
jgi:transglutaminase-like putative cysteine protease